MNLNVTDRILVNTEQLQYLLGGCGRRYAQKIGELAKAEVRIGNRLLYSVQKIREFAYQEAMNYSSLHIFSSKAPYQASLLLFL